MNVRDEYPLLQRLEQRAHNAGTQPVPAVIQELTALFDDFQLAAIQLGHGGDD